MMLVVLLALIIGQSASGSQSISLYIFQATG
jgi:hypothetical protein